MFSSLRAFSRARVCIQHISQDFLISCDLFIARTYVLVVGSDLGEGLEHFLDLVVLDSVKDIKLGPQDEW